jgi:RNA polymerase sigma factor (TIGR02999 family)
VQFRAEVAQVLKKNCSTKNTSSRVRDRFFNKLTSSLKEGYCVFLRNRGGGAVPQSSSQPISELLAQWRTGDEESLRRLVPLVYNELRRLAHYYLRRERPDHTLQTTALVHEAYLCLMKQQSTDFENRAHFFAVCANLMREILVQYARRRKAAKRDAGYKLTLDGALALPGGRNLDLVALDDALHELAKLDPQQSRIVELRFFGGLSIQETSQVLGISPATVKRHWTTARVWLHDEINRSKRHDA